MMAMTGLIAQKKLEEPQELQKQNLEAGCIWLLEPRMMVGPPMMSMTGSEPEG
jgi:hypothetical protein